MFVQEIDEEDEKVLNMFMLKDAGPQSTLADLIIQRMKDKDAQVDSGEIKISYILLS